MRRTRDARELPIVGSEWWFEYHCNESHDSADAELWYRSHQRVTVLAVEPNDADGLNTFRARLRAAVPVPLRVRFADGWEGTAMEDELIYRRSGFTRPDPPSKRATERARKGR